MKIFLISLTIISSVLMIVVILLQQGKGAELGAAFGRGAQGGLFTASGKANFLTRMTSALVTIFLLSSLALGFLIGDSNKDGVFEELGGDAPDAAQQLDALDAPAADDFSDDAAGAGGDADAPDDAGEDAAPAQTPN